MLVSAELAKEKLARICDQANDLIREDAKVNTYLAGAYHANAEVAHLIRNTDLTDCQPQISGEAAEIVAALRKHDPVRSPYKTAFTMENAARFIEELVGVIAPAPDQGSVRNATDELDAKRWKFFLSRIVLGNLARQGKRWSIEADLAYGPGILTLEDAIDAAIRALPDQKD